jgi:hypothetical protein
MIVEITKVSPALAEEMLLLHGSVRAAITAIQHTNE